MKLSVFFQLLKETGVDSGEAWKLLWTEINAEGLTFDVRPTKNHNARTEFVGTRHKPDFCRRMAIKNYHKKRLEIESPNKPNIKEIVKEAREKPRKHFLKTPIRLQRAASRKTLQKKVFYP